MTTMSVLDSTGSTVAVEKPLTPGRAADTASRPVALSNEDVAILSALAAGMGTTADTAWASGNGSQIALLKAIASAALDTTTQTPVNVKAYTANSKYETVAASASAQALGPTGATGDYLSHVLIVPATTSPGAVSVADGSGSAITIFTGGASSVASLVPFAVPLGLVSTSGAWKVTTGANVSVIGAGNFT